MENFNFQFPQMHVGRFVLKQGEVIPLHIHPEQYATAYAIAGKAQIMSYDITSQNGQIYGLRLKSKEV